MTRKTWIQAGLVALTAMGASAVMAANTSGALGGASGVEMTPDGPKSGSNKPVSERGMSERSGQGMLESVPRDAGNTAGGNRDMGRAMGQDQHSDGQRQSGAQTRKDATQNAENTKHDTAPAGEGREGHGDAADTPPVSR